MANPSVYCFPDLSDENKFLPLQYLIINLFASIKIIDISVGDLVPDSNDTFFFTFESRWYPGSAQKRGRISNTYWLYLWIFGSPYVFFWLSLCLYGALSVFSDSPYVPMKLSISLFLLSLCFFGPSYVIFGSPYVFLALNMFLALRMFFFGSPYVLLALRMFFLAPNIFFGSPSDLFWLTVCLFDSPYVFMALLMSCFWHAEWFWALRMPFLALLFCLFWLSLYVFFVFFWLSVCLFLGFLMYVRSSQCKGRFIRVYENLFWDALRFPLRSIWD